MDIRFIGVRFYKLISELILSKQINGDFYIVLHLFFRDINFDSAVQ